MGMMEYFLIKRKIFLWFDWIIWGILVISWKLSKMLEIKIDLEILSFNRKIHLGNYVVATRLVIS